VRARGLRDAGEGGRVPPARVASLPKFGVLMFGVKWVWGVWWCVGVGVFGGGVLWG